MRVSEMLPTDRPDARLRQHGPSSLSTVELVALTVGLTDLKVSNDLMAKARGELRQLARMSATEANLTPARHARMAATFELARRFCAEERPTGKPIHSPRDVVQLMAPRMEDLPYEEFHVLILDAQHRMERDVLVTRGILNSSLVHPREVFREAIKEAAAAVVLVHNHPSGDPAPSADDRAVTEQLAAAGRVLDIPVHDHVIIGRGRYTSFAEAGLL